MANTYGLVNFATAGELARQGKLTADILAGNPKSFDFNFYPPEYFSGADVTFFLCDLATLSEKVREFAKETEPAIKVGLYSQFIEDEIVTLQFVVAQARTPLYRYSDFLWHRVAKGTRIVSGSFRINYTEPHKIAKRIDGNISTPKPDTTSYNDSMSKWDNMSATDRIEYLSKTDISEDSFTSIVANSLANPVVADDLDKGLIPKRLITFENPTIDRGFTICIFYRGGKGGAKANYGPGKSPRQLQFLDTVLLISQGQTIMINGRPTFEEYSFIARDFI